MAIEMLTYAALAERLKISPEAARALASGCVCNGRGRMTEKRS